jgi:hypothetical protein
LCQQPAIYEGAAGGQDLYLLLEFAFSAIIASSDAAASAGQCVRDGPASVALPFLRTGSALTERANMAPVRVPAILVEDLILLCYAHFRRTGAWY